jgi:hypothetical protein
LVCCKNQHAASLVARLALAASLLAATVPAQAPDAASVIRSVDAAVARRVDNVLGFTDTEHYAVYRGRDELHPAAEMTVIGSYKKDVGKSYTILSESGSSIIQRFGLKPLLANEQNINLPENVKRSWFVSANYDMKVRPGGPVPLNGRSCFVLDIRARQKAPNLIDGSIWVDVRDGTLVQIDGVATAAATPYSGPAHMVRQYANMNGFSMATHARAESNSFLFGRTVVTVDYSNYRLQLEPLQ